MLRTKLTHDDFIHVTKFVNFSEAFAETLTGRMLADHGIEVDKIQRVERATRSLVEGRIVIGSIPIYLASYAQAVISIYFRGGPLTENFHIPAEKLRRLILEEHYYIIGSIDFKDLLSTK